MTIKLNNISKQFNGKQIFNDFSYQFENSQLYLIIGESGIGKTTLLDIIMSLETPDAGEVIIDDSFSCAFQQNRLFNGYDSYTNISLFTTYSKDQIVAYFTKLLPISCLNQKVGTLSEGQKKKLNILRTLLASSSCLIFDEPFNDLDEQSIKDVTNLIFELQNKRTIIISSHQTESLKSYPFEIIKLG